MTIENRNLAVGTVLVATYKGEDYSATVVEGEGGSLRFRLEDGHACNGWRFWSLATGQTGEAMAGAELRSKARGKTKREMEGSSSEPTTEEQQAE